MNIGEVLVSAGVAIMLFILIIGTCMVCLGSRRDGFKMDEIDIDISKTLQSVEILRGDTLIWKYDGYCTVEYKPKTRFCTITDNEGLRHIFSDVTITVHEKSES